MPIYEYLCPACSHQYEKREGFDAPARQKCPNCGKRARRVLHAASVVFKGSGFYITDSRKSADTSEVSASSESSTKPTSEPSTSPKPSKNGSDSASSSDSGSKDTKAAATN